MNEKKKAAKRKRSNESSKAISYFTKVVASVDVAVAVAVAVVINVAFKCAFHGQTRQRPRQRLTTPSVRLNYVRVLRVLADFVIRFSLELTHNYGQCQHRPPPLCSPLHNCLFSCFCYSFFTRNVHSSHSQGRAAAQGATVLGEFGSVWFWFGNLLWVKWAPK